MRKSIRRNKGAEERQTATQNYGTRSLKDWDNKEDKVGTDEQLKDCKCIIVYQDVPSETMENVVSR